MCVLSSCPSWGPRTCPDATNQSRKKARQSSKYGTDSERIGRRNAQDRETSDGPAPFESIRERRSRCEEDQTVQLAEVSEVGLVERQQRTAVTDTGRCEAMLE